MTTAACAVRAATPGDAPEVVRLRQAMFDAMGVSAPQDGGAAWRARAVEMLRAELSAGASDTASGAAPGRYGVFVVDDPEEPGRLAACAVGTIEERLPAPKHPDGLFGFVFNICTDPARRRRGYARACTEALLAWFDARGVTRIDLHATPDGEALYRALGFTEHSLALSREPRHQAC